MTLPTLILNLIFFIKVFQMSEVSSTEALPEPNTDVQNALDKLREELEHLRHERNVYEESYIRIQRELDQIQKDHDSLQGDLKSKQDIIDGFDIQLEQERNTARNEMEMRVKKEGDKMDEREKELVENHLEERLEMENLIGKLKVSRS